MACKRNRGRDRALAEVAGTQEGIVSLKQLEDVGISKRAAADRAGSGRLHRIHRGIYAVGHDAVLRTGRLRAAVLACGNGSVVSHGTAAAFWGIWDSWPTLIDITVPCETGRKIAGIRPRRCRYPLPEEITFRNGIPCTTVARTLVDLAGPYGHTTVRRTIEAAAVRRLLDIRALEFALEAGKGRPGVKAMWAIAAEWRTPDGETPDVRSIFEARILPALRRLGASEPICNQALKVHGRVFRPDFLWPEQRLIVETDGEATHANPVAFRRDRDRDQLLVAGGYRVARFTWEDIRDRPTEAIARIEQMLALSVVPYAR